MEISTAEQFLSTRTTDIGNEFVRWRKAERKPKLKSQGEIASVSGWKALVRKQAKEMGLRELSGLEPGFSASTRRSRYSEVESSDSDSGREANDGESLKDASSDDERTARRRRARRRFVQSDNDADADEQEDATYPKRSTGIRTSKRSRGAPATRKDTISNTVQDPTACLGRRVAKYFDEDLYFGTVKNVRTDEKGPMWFIQYDDGDNEEFEEDELLQHMSLYTDHEEEDTHNRRHVINRSQRLVVNHENEKQETKGVR
jgi:hypothetical protein